MSQHGFITVLIPGQSTPQHFSGTLFGNLDINKDKKIVGEVVFQTGMVGYPESLTDPSYRNQILVLTYPLIGSYGVPNETDSDRFGIPLNVESSEVHVKALVVGEYINTPSHHQSAETLEKYLKRHAVTGIQGIDTRRLTKLIREHGTLRGTIYAGKEPCLANDIPPATEAERNLAQQVSRKELRIIGSGTNRVLVVDCGIKNNQLRMMLFDSNGKERDVQLYIVGVEQDFASVFEQYECQRLFISNGPGDPRDCSEFIGRLKKFMARPDREDVPIFGICLGHQLLALAAGFSVEKMKYGNRGHNLPCEFIPGGGNISHNRAFITTQNHGFAVNTSGAGSWITDGAEWSELFRNLNDGSNEGMIHYQSPWFSVQFHPEAKAGPEDTSCLFDVFLDEPSSWTTNVRINRQNLRATICNKFQLDSGPTVKVVQRERSKVLILGSGGLCIGQSGEFDYSGSQAIKAYKEEGLTTILVNPNIATVQTTPGFVDKIYFLPVTSEYVAKVIEIERPDCIALSFGGQTALNCGAELDKIGVLEEYDIEVLGTPIESILKTEDRNIFKSHIQSIGEKIPNGAIAASVETAVSAAKEIGYPVLVRAAFALGGLGSGFANNEEELLDLLQISFSNSDQVIIDKSLKGWKEVEYEIVRDRFGNCISVCNMENFDPLGVHTGESIVIAPSQTLTDQEYNMLRSTSVRTVSSFNIVGECNIQFALDPRSKEYFIIEINARLSRSSALASKATGYPLAYIAAKLGLGYGLPELKNSITKTTTACFEPSLDYCVVKIPRWDLKKFEHVNEHIGSAMKSVGEGMAIGRTFEEALQSCLRMTGMSQYGLEPGVIDCTEDELRNPTYRRILAIATGLADESDIWTVDRIHDLSGIDLWFLHKLKNIICSYKKQKSRGRLRKVAGTIRKAKKLGFSDAAIAHNTGSTELAIRAVRLKHNILSDVKKIDTVAAEFPCDTNYLFTTYATTPQPTTTETVVDPNKILVLGSGVYKIGSSVEFDWCAVSCIRQLRAMGKTVVMVNCNPETVSTDYDEADKLYFTEVSLESVLDIYEREKPAGIIVSVGGQLPNNIAIDLHLQGIPVIGTSPENIDRAENRHKFSRMLDVIGVDQPEWRQLTSIEEAIQFCQNVSYPALVRPSYVLSGAAMNVAYSDSDLKKYLGAAVEVSREYPVVISKFINDAKEIEVDAIAQHGEVKIMAISEHVENAGVHSGDATLVFPAQDLTQSTTDAVTRSTKAIAKALEIHGPFNIQFIAKDDKCKVIECNLRVSRSFPFVSKTMGINMVGKATEMWMSSSDGNLNSIEWNHTKPTRIGVKVPQFSFNRLTGADILLGVEMQSTGEVACFGKTQYEAYLKGLVAAGFVLPEKGSKILISIGGYAFKREFRSSVDSLKSMGYQLYATRNTASYYGIEELRLHSSKTSENILNWITEHKIQCVINVTERNKMRCVEDQMTDGYKMRRAAIESNVPIVTDIKVAKLLVKSLGLVEGITVNSEIDCFTLYKPVRIPGLIDVHVHVREPGETYKEDWETCTNAALAGGITMICAMPNTNPPLCDNESYELTEHLASTKAKCDYALFAGASSNNCSTINELADKCAGLKMYLNNTHGPLLLHNTLDWMEHLRNWNHPTHPVCVHAEGQTLAAILHVAWSCKRRLHVCHVARKEEIIMVKRAKELGMNVTCEVAPHHLFMVQTDALEPMDQVKPPLQHMEDQQALWDNLDIIDCFATDHAPHTRPDKIDKGCPGFPGLETALPLLLTEVNKVNARLTLDDIVQRYHTNPKRIFGLPDQPDTFVEIDMNCRHVIPKDGGFSKANWTPFAGRECVGAVKRVVMRGKTVYISDQRKNTITSKCGTGVNVRLIESVSNTPIKAYSFSVESPVTLKKRQKRQKRQKGDTNLLERSWFSDVDLRQRHVLSSEQFTKDWLRVLFRLADTFRKEHSNILQGKKLGLFFYEPSTRTRLSFETAMKNLGGDVVYVAASQSSVKKGESLQDSILCMQYTAQVDAIVLRHHDVGAAKRAAAIAKVPIINAGDGAGEHPTQTLVDLYTIREELGTVGGLCVTIVGDLRYGRTVHSLVKALALRDDVQLNYVSKPAFGMPDDIQKYVREKGVEQKEFIELSDEVLAVTDVLYVTRCQTERSNQQDHKPTFKITPAVLAKTKPTMRVLHPLPRGDEISPVIDTDPRAAYMRQMENGVYVRMALLALLYGE